MLRLAMDRSGAVAACVVSTRLLWPLAPLLLALLGRTSGSTKVICSFGEEGTPTVAARSRERRLGKLPFADLDEDAERLRNRSAIAFPGWSSDSWDVLTVVCDDATLDSFGLSKDIWGEVLVELSLVDESIATETGRGCECGVGERGGERVADWLRKAGFEGGPGSESGADANSGVREKGKNAERFFRRNLKKDEADAGELADFSMLVRPCSLPQLCSDREDSDIRGVETAMAESW